MKIMDSYRPSPVLMPPVKTTLKDDVCEACTKEDVCSIKEEFTKAYKDILDIEDRTNVFINTSVKCKKFLRRIENNGVR